MYCFLVPDWNLFAWVFLLVSLLAMETVGLLVPRDHTLSQLIRKAIPTWLRAIILAWLSYHFLVQTGK